MCKTFHRRAAEKESAGARVALLALAIVAGASCDQNDQPQASNPERRQPMAENVIALTDATFAAEVEQAKGVCLVDFWAEWCAPCRMVGPTVAALGTEYAGKAKICKLDTDAHRDIPARFGISAIPTLIIFKDGEPVKRFVGVTTKDDIKAALDEAISKK
jgi:thioredoxin 1